MSSDSANGKSQPKIDCFGCFGLIVFAFATLFTLVALLPAPKKERPSAENSEEVLAKQHEDQKKAERIASGEHCLSGWDGSFPSLKEAVKKQLRNPKSFEHVQTVRSPVDDKGSFGLIMKYRAENGFGGMNVEAIGVDVDAKTCRFKRANNASLAKRLSGS